MRSAYRKRRVHLPPGIQNFKPGGIPRKLLKKIIITVDEFEAFRLADYKGLSHLEAAQKMDISRPTFTRLIEKVRHKVSQALVDGMELQVEGGNVEFTHALYRCLDCGEMQINLHDVVIGDCPECGSKNIEDMAGNWLELNNRNRNKKRGKKHE